MLDVLSDRGQTVTAAATVLVAEDDAGLSSVIADGLRDEGYRVDAVANGAGTLERAVDPDVDLLILDLGLPDVDGGEVLRLLRGRGCSVPVIVLTARSDSDDLVRGLETGADDYMTKPFAFDELIARVRARLRSGVDRPSILRAGAIRLGLVSHRASVDGRLIELSPTEFSILESLLRHAGEIVTRQKLRSDAWTAGLNPGPRALDPTVGRLRRKIGADRIETVRSAGYRLIVED